ncbi:stearoyl-CoA desaturase (delta-9 desaturase) [Singulisphaera sp. GP187]|uniref:acyl-CoA desaturase n=1 Tax=Singulisphaera sp. GP187 TaxID=1882752 RepID=UPI000929A2F6|nr:fatty acid desaturase [Singulisphaera sp. GP187]SIO59663.1 stearoyl-CoA desaturase (delta-9 desaturase) [Singulisphaera sp. GP187]
MSTTLSDPAPQKIAWAPLIWIGALHVGALLAFVPAYFTWQAVALCFFLHWVTGGLGITMTYHRLLTHRSFATRPKALEYVLTAIGCCASEGGPIGWVSDHRRHHAHSDEEDDVHSPNRGFGWAHMFWWMTPDITSIHTPEYYQRWAPDLCKDPVLRWLDKYFILFPILLGVGLYAIGGMPWLVWGGFVRSVFVLHSTWLVNSATHIWGYRSHETRDKSTNLWWVAVVTYGEGWHNNHHAFQTSARHGLRWWEVDMTYMTIRLLSFLGLAYAIKMPKIPKTTAASPDRLVEDAAGSDPEMTTVSGTASDEPELAVASK